MKIPVSIEKHREKHFLFDKPHRDYAVTGLFIRAAVEIIIGLAQ